MREIKATLIASVPVPVIVIEHNEPDPRWLKELVKTGEIESSVKTLAGQDCFEALLMPGCRGVPLDRLTAILSVGVDVSPTDSVIWVEFLEKAVEYGSVEGVVVMVFDAELLEPASIEISPSMTESQIDALRRDYPTRIDNYHGNVLVSRLPEGKGDAGYALLYGRWIRSDPWNVLKTIIVIAREGNDLPHEVSEMLTTLSHWQV